ncbi:MAG TPA: tryptophan--tRNA ligase [Candidatus Altiarchaeales archaeon]|nr:tryptophan--tRNA ligase [Candidatus Altiarchaeales archaeon]
MKELNPWEVGEIKDYGKLIKEFGMKPMDDYRIKYDDLLYIRRGIIFGHRDFNLIDEAIEKKKPYALMTGLMPSGAFHFGHKMVADEIKYFQDNGAQIFICAADIESYLMRGIPLDVARKTAVEDYLTNYLALGINPENLTFWFQSDYRTEYYRMRDLLSKRPTFNELKAIYGELSTGKIISALTQAADILHPQLKELGGKKPVIVPVGADQDPHIRLTRDIASRETEYDIIPPAATYHKFMGGLQGGKMSSSDPKSHISLLEEPKKAIKKVMGAKTGGRESAEVQRKKGGRPDQCMIYELCLYHLVPDDIELARIHAECVSGATLCGDCKKRCAGFLTTFLEEHQKKVAQARKTAEKIAKKKT